MKVLDTCGIAHEIAIEQIEEGYKFSVDGAFSMNEKVVEAFGGDMMIFNRMLKLYTGSEHNPAVSSSKSRLELALLFCVLPVQAGAAAVQLKGEVA